MADAVTTNVIFNGSTRYAARFTNISDGTGETNVIKVDISTLTLPDGTPCTRCAFEELKWDVHGFSSVKASWDHNTDDTAEVMSGQGTVSYAHLGYMFDPASAGGTGDVLFTTNGPVAGATYDITLVLQLR